MKLFHLSDLHLGKRVYDFSMLEDQEYILRQILRAADAEQPDAVLLAGDIYDKPVPPAEAVRLFDDILVSLSRRGIPVLLIPGNHDSAERVAFGGRLMAGSRVYPAPAYTGAVAPVTLSDAWGPVNFYLLPFVRAAHVRAAFPEEEIADMTDALRAAIARMDLDPAARNVLVAHQFVTGASRCESEEVSLGGADGVDAAVFAPFDYVALGHIHGPQSFEGGRVRYCGTPLKYSFSECRHHKSITVAELGEKGSLHLRMLPLTPLRELRELRGSYAELTIRANYEGTATDDYLHLILTDEEDVPDALARLRVIYPNVMKLDYDNTRTRLSAELTAAPEAERRTEIDLFADFYALQNGQPLSEEQRALSERIFAELKEETP